MTDDRAEEFRWYVGIDWATAAHQVCVYDAGGHVVREQAVAHTADGLAAFVAALGQLTDGALQDVAVGIETPRGAVVETLLERGAAVFAINPKQVDRFRDRFTVAGAKDDRRDARVLGSALRTDRRAFQRVVVDDPQIIQLRELARADEDLAEESTRLTNRLREQVHRVAPEWLALCPAATEAWFWDVLEASLGGSTPKRGAIERVLRRHRIRRLTAHEVHAVVATPTVYVAPGAREATRRHIALLLPRLRLVSEQRRACKRELEALLASLTEGDSAGDGGASAATSMATSDVAIVRSIPGIGRVVSATLFAEAATLLRLRNYPALRALSGLAPVTRQSGGSRRVGMRRACNKRLRNACYHWARTSMLFDPAAQAYYAALRARGHSHGRALRSVADRGLRILFAMLRTHTLFNADLASTRRQPVPA